MRRDGRGGRKRIRLSRTFESVARSADRNDPLATETGRLFTVPSEEEREFFFTNTSLDRRVGVNRTRVRSREMFLRARVFAFDEIPVRRVPRTICLRITMLQSSSARRILVISNWLAISCPFDASREHLQTKCSYRTFNLEQPTRSGTYHRFQHLRTIIGTRFEAYRAHFLESNAASWDAHKCVKCHT